MKIFYIIVLSLTLMASFYEDSVMDEELIAFEENRPVVAVDYAFIK